MSLSRRDFHKLLGLGLLSLGIPKISNARNSFKTDPTGVPILQGSTTADSTQITVLGLRQEAYDFEVKEKGSTKTITPKNLQIFEKNYSQWVNYHIDLEGLELGKEYELIVRLASSGEVVDLRSFKSLNLDKPQLKWVFGSCMYEGKHKKAIWDSLHAQQPEFIIFVGDSVYIDRKWGDSKEISEERLWGRHIQSRLILDIYYWPQLIPVLATWDDHDYGLNNSNRSFSLKDQSREIFDIFFPCYEGAHIERGPGVAKKLITQGQDFYLLDNRSFRSEKRAAQEEYFGEQQLLWMEKTLDKEKLNWLMQGSQWTTSYDRTENFQRTHKKAFLSTFQRLKDLQARFVLCSGDVHFSEVSNIPQSLLGYNTLELTSSSLHSRSVPGFNYIFKNKNRIVATPSKNYLLIESEDLGQGVLGSVSSYSTKQKLKFAVNLNRIRF